MLENQDISVVGNYRDYVRSDIIYTEWQGKSCIYAIRISGENSSYSKIIFKSYSEIMNLYEKFRMDEEVKQYLPVFPVEKYIINGSTTKIEYRRLTLDYFIQNLLLQEKLQESFMIVNFFKLIKESPSGGSRHKANKNKVKLKIMLLNRHLMQVEVDRSTEAVEVCEWISEQLKIHYVKDKRLFLVQRQRIVKVLDNNELILKVIENFQGQNKIGKISVRKIKKDSSELTALGRYLNLPDNDQLTFVFMKWCYLPYDFSLQENDETLDTLNLKAIHAIAEFQTKRFRLPPEIVCKFIGLWCSLNHDKALEICEINSKDKNPEEVIDAIQNTAKLSRISSLLAANDYTATSADLQLIKDLWIKNRYEFHTKERFMNFIKLSITLPSYGVSLFWGEVYKVKE